MSIFNKIFRGTVANDKTGDPLRTGGQIVNDNFDIAETALLDRLLRVDSVEDIAGFVGDYDGQQISLLGWHPDSDIGGGVLYWDSSKAKSNHNGGTVFSPTVPWTATVSDYLDGVGETDGSGFGCWVRILESSLSPEFFGAILDGSADSSESIQKTVYALGSLPNEVKTLLLRGVLKITKPILFYAIDGLKVIGQGKVGTQILLDGNMSPVFDSDFTRLQSDGIYDYSFPAGFIVAAARRTGKANWAVVQDNTAQWHTAFEDFSFVRLNEDRTVHGIHAPAIANTKFNNMLFKGVTSGIKSQIFYTIGLNDCFFTKVTTPIDHYNTAGITANGTSVHLSTCSVSDCDYGWKFNKLFYSTMTACACDGWARYQPAGDYPPESYAYNLHQCSGFVLTSCGAEDPVSNRMKGLFKFTGGSTSSVVVDGGAYVIADVPSTTNIALCKFDSQSVTLRGPTFLLNTLGGKIPYCEVLSGDVIVETLNQAIEWSRLFNFSNAAPTARLLGNDPKNLCAVESFLLATVPFVSNGTTPLNFGSNNLPFPNRWDAWDGSTFTAPYAGTFLINIAVNLSGAGVNYLTARINGGSDRLFFTYDSAGTQHKQYTPSTIVHLNKGDELQVILRTITGASGNVLNAGISIFPVR